MAAPTRSRDRRATGAPDAPDDGRARDDRHHRGTSGMLEIGATGGRRHGGRLRRCRCRPVRSRRRSRRSTACRVIGIAGGPEKSRVVARRVRSRRVRSTTRPRTSTCVLGELCPDGIDVVFENVGGATLDVSFAASSRSAPGSVLCGAISALQRCRPAPSRCSWYMNFVASARGWRASSCSDYLDRFPEAGAAARELGRWRARSPGATRSSKGSNVLPRRSTCSSVARTPGSSSCRSRRTPTA